MKYFLNIEKNQTIEELQNGQAEGMNIPFDSEQQVKDSAKWFVESFFLNQDVEVSLIINRHEENLPCSKIEIKY